MTVRDREDAVIARLHSLAPHLDGEPDPAFQAATRARLVAMAAVRTPAAPPLSPLRRLVAEGVAAPARWRTRLTAGLAGAALGVTAVAALVAVATDARPGDVLYDLKRGTEQTQLALAGSARGEKLLGLASTRLDEVRTLVENGATALPAVGASGAGPAETVLAAGPDEALVVETLETMDDQTAEGAAWLTERAASTEDAGPLEVLAAWTTTQSEGLAELRDAVPSAAADEVADSLVLLTDISTRVSGLGSSLDCAAGPALGGADELGPVPAPCPPDGSTTTAPGGSGDGSTASPEVPGSTSTSDPAPQPGSSAPPEGGVVPGVPGVPGIPGVPSVPGLPGGTGSGGLLPTPAVPSLPTTILPIPRPPSTAPSVPRLPGTKGIPLPTPAPPDLPDVCLGPVAIGDC